MSQQFESLNQKTKMIDVALKYTNGDMAKAKAMASGQYQDIVAIKGKFLFQESNKSGMFLSFFNVFDEFIAYINSSLSVNESIYKTVRIFDDWKSLFEDLVAYKEAPDNIDSSSFSDFLLDSFISHDVFPFVQDGNLDDLSRVVSESLKAFFKQDSVQSQIELETTNSLSLELGGISFDIPGSNEEPQEKETQEKIEVTEEDETINKIESEANYIVDGKIIVSPVKGKYINDITTGEKIMVLLTGRDPLTRKILTVLEGYSPEGEVKAIKGRLREKVPLEKGGYILYALVAKGVLAKIIEEENVKVQLEPSEEKIKKTKGDEESGNKAVYLMAVLVGLIILGGIILLQML